MKKPVADTSVDYVTALDVLEYIRDDSSIVEEFHRVLRPGGLAVITVPADMKLWSDWDVSLYHHRRYDRKSLKSLFVPAEWELIHVAYHNTLAYPIVFILRKWRKWTKKAGESGDRAEDQLPSPLINRILYFLYTAPAKTSWFPAPFGVSLLLVAKKR
jgi:SAM-dependent methyltransferase